MSEPRKLTSGDVFFALLEEVRMSDGEIIPRYRGGFSCEREAEEEASYLCIPRDRFVVLEDTIDDSEGW